MKLVIILAYVICALSLMVHAQSATPSAEDTPVRIQMPNFDLTEILKLYSRLSGRKIWVEPGLSARVSIVTHRPIPRAEALSLIRGTLLSQGIAIREKGEKDAFVSRSTDPQIQDLRFPQPSPADRVRAPSAVPRP